MKTTLALVLILALLMTACTTSQVVSTLENVVSVAEIAVPVIGAATGLSPQVSAQIVSYLEQVNIAAAQASTILSGLSSPAQKSAEILQAFAKIAAGCNCVTAGTPAEVVAVIDAVAKAVLNFLANFQSKTLITATAPATKISSTDRVALANIRTRAEKNIANLKGVKK